MENSEKSLVFFRKVYSHHPLKFFRLLEGGEDWKPLPKPLSRLRMAMT